MFRLQQPLNRYVIIQKPTKTKWLVRKVTAIALDIQGRICTGCNNCVVACPVNALELTVLNPVTKKKTYNVLNGKAVVVDEDVCNGCGICLMVCPQRAITLTTE